MNKEPVPNKEEWENRMGKEISDLLLEEKSLTPDQWDRLENSILILLRKEISKQKEKIIKYLDDREHDLAEDIKEMGEGNQESHTATRLYEVRKIRDELFNIQQ
jgi:hypothetical protein